LIPSSDCWKSAVAIESTHEAVTNLGIKFASEQKRAAERRVEIGLGEDPWLVIYDPPEPIHDWVKHYVMCGFV